MALSFRQRFVRWALGTDPPSGEIITLDDPSGWKTAGALTGNTQRAAMKISAINNCVEVITNSISKLPIYIMDGNTKEHLRGHPLIPLLTVRPNEAMTPATYKKLIETHRLMWGNAYVWVNRDARSARPVELVPVAPHYVTPYG